MRNKEITLASRLHEMIEFFEFERLRCPWGHLLLPTLDLLTGYRIAWNIKFSYSLTFHCLRVCEPVVL